MYKDILDYSETKLNVKSINYVLSSIKQDNDKLFDHIDEYIQLHSIEMNFSTYLLKASHAKNYEEFKKLISDALEYAKNTGDCNIIKSYKIKEQVNITYF